MNKTKGWIWMVVLLALVLPGALLAGCAGGKSSLGSVVAGSPRYS